MLSFYDYTLQMELFIFLTYNNVSNFISNTLYRLNNSEMTSKKAIANEAMLALQKSGKYNGLWLSDETLSREIN